MQLNFTKLFKLLSQLRDIELIENSIASAKFSVNCEANNRVQVGEDLPRHR